MACSLDIHSDGNPISASSHSYSEKIGSDLGFLYLKIGDDSICIHRLDRMVAARLAQAINEITSIEGCIGNID